jgi:hypothetical protein
MSHLLKNLLIVLGVTLFLGVLYVTLVRDTGSEEVTTGGEKKEVTLKTEKILSDIQEIEKYKVDTTLFEDSRFLSLKDFRVKIEDVDTSRDNPFEPVE